MLYAWIDENGTLCTTFELASVPEKYRSSVKIFENLSIHDWDKLYVDENGEIKIKSEEQILAERKQRLLQELKQVIYSVLLQTDWVLIKCAELKLDPEEAYPEIMAKRGKIRQINKKIEEKIKQAKTLDVLEEIEKEIRGLSFEG